MTAPEFPEKRAVEILLIEANHGDVRLVKESFADAGVMNAMHVVYDATEAVDFIHQRGEYTDAPVPDIVLLDLELPGGKSENVPATLTDRPELASILVIGMTGSAAEADIVRSSGLGADACIRKPLDPDEFIDVVRNRGEYGITIVRQVPTETV